MSKYAALQHPAPTPSWSLFDFAAAAIVAPVFQAAEIAGDLLTPRAPRRPALRPQPRLQPSRPRPAFSWRKRSLALG